jgi:hypothetical protein
VQLFVGEANRSFLVVANEDPEIVDREIERVSRLEMFRRKPLYVTYSIPEGQDLPAFVL